MQWKECQKVDVKLRFMSRFMDGEMIATLCRKLGIPAGKRFYAAFSV